MWIQQKVIGAEEQLPKPIKSALERNDHCWATFGREEVDLHRSTVLHAVAGTHVQDVDGSIWISSYFLPMYILQNVKVYRYFVHIMCCTIQLT